MADLHGCIVVGNLFKFLLTYGLNKQTDFETMDSLFLPTFLSRQFKYDDPNSKHCEYMMQLGIILKREHPGIVEEKDGDVIKT